MRIWQIDTAGDPNGVDGVAHVVWPVCERLSAAGHEVTIFVRTPPTEAARLRAASAGIHLVEALHTRLGINVAPVWHQLRKAPPDVVQVHVPLIPQCAAVVRLCRLRGIPWVYTTHGGLAPEILQLPRTARQRLLYTTVLERPMIRDAIAVVYCNETERFEARSVAEPKGIEMVIEPPVAQSIFDAPPWELPTGDPVALYLGRYDVYQKGIDRLTELFRLLPEVRLRVVGEAAPSDRAAMETIIANAPPNVTFEPPVRGADKTELLRSATMYVQVSRFEGFPVSVAEALTIGTPTAVVRTLGIATTIRGSDIGLCLDADLHRAAAQIRDALSDPERLRGWSRASRSYAAEHFALDAVAKRYLDLYRRLR